ncbi:MAG: ABC transporter substrate-binding protein [Chloroflexi bacterium]|nr:ABC transporter substrate-binding protein [Chloroflexota bacterium]
MKKVILAVSVILSLLAAACQPLMTPPAQVELTIEAPAESPTAPEETEAATEVQVTPEPKLTGDVSLTSEHVSVDYAKNFSIEYGEGYKLLTVLQPWAGAEQAFRYVLIPRGASVPDEAGNAMPIETPVESFVAMSTTYYPFLEWIDKLNTVTAIDDPAYVFNADIQSRAASGEIAVVGSGATADIETLVALNPDVVMTNAYGSVYDSHPKMIEANLPVVINADYLEESPLGRAEWGKFIAAFYDQEDVAAVEFEKVVSAYNQTKQLAESMDERVTVIVNTDYQGTWYVPGAQSYPAHLMKDAGANYVFADQEGSTLPLSFEVVFDKGKDADYWINVGFPADKASLLGLDSRYAEFKAFKTDHVYNNNARSNANGGSDYFESGVARPDVVLKDLVKVFYPDLLPDYELYYYQLLK